MKLVPETETKPKSNIKKSSIIFMFFFSEQLLQLIENTFTNVLCSSFLQYFEIPFQTWLGFINN